MRADKLPKPASVCDVCSALSNERRNLTHRCERMLNGRRCYVTVNTPTTRRAVQGIRRGRRLGVVLYVKESEKPEPVERYGRGRPYDWIERNFYSKVATYGVSVPRGLDLVVFGIVPGVLIWLPQIAWIPFLA